MNSHEVLEEQYTRRFHAAQAYRDRVWVAILHAKIQKLVGYERDILDLGCGWGEFIRNVAAGNKYAMDLNPDAANYLGDDVQFLHQDCSTRWLLEDNSLDVVFSSNFIEHLPSKEAIEAMVGEANRCLRPGGTIIFLGPNIRYVGGAYWDYWDHHVPITDRSLIEMLELHNFEIVNIVRRFLPYTMSGGFQPPVQLVRLYLALPLFWPLLGKQFLVVAKMQ
ncbi:class I SAM-dependent methyltransferase [Pseudomonadota bacterium]